MKKITTLIACALLATPVVAEESKPYTQWDTFRFTIDNKQKNSFS